MMSAGTPSALERLVHGHRVWPGGDGDPADPVGGGDGRRDGRELRDLTAPGDDEDIVLVRERGGITARQRPRTRSSGPFRRGADRRERVSSAGCGPVEEPAPGGRFLRRPDDG
ncbi:hypothetical protein HBB16_01280 [Pseudonocardia sp. MCCB 268]|nr:hypothetical protein [Pseudonocardia cytotoxica]